MGANRLAQGGSQAIPMDPINLDLYDFAIDPQLIAQYPRPNREQSRLLIIDRKGSSFQEERFENIDRYLRPGDLLIRNITYVEKRRVWLKRQTGRSLPCLFLPQLSGELIEVLLPKARKLREGEILWVERDSSKRFSFHRKGSSLYLQPHFSFDASSFFSQYGEIPIPPYLKRKPFAGEEDRYNTIFAKVPGSVAAPTAGLHFTQTILHKIERRGILMADLVLTIGYGTFAPLQKEQIKSQTLHRERYSIPRDTVLAIRQAQENGKRIIAIGTTTVRAVESAAPTIFSGKPRDIEATTDLFIAPPYRFRVIDGLITNFHLPRSSLFVLVCAFAGRERMFDAYRYAQQRGFRFYSYGDACLIL